MRCGAVRYRCRCSAETGTRTHTHLERVVRERAVVVEHEQLEARAHGGEVRVPARRELFAAAQVELLEPHGQAAARRREILERAVREARALRDAQRHEVLAEAARTQSYVCTDPSSRGSRMTAQEKRRIAGVQAGAGADALGDAPDGGVADGRAREVQVEQHRALLHHRAHHLVLCATRAGRGAAHLYTVLVLVRGRVKQGTCVARTESCAQSDRLRSCKFLHSASAWKAAPLSRSCVHARRLTCTRNGR